MVYFLVKVNYGHYSNQKGRFSKLLANEHAVIGAANDPIINHCMGDHHWEAYL